MANNQCYFEEWNLPPAGIDTISVWINPTLINKDKDKDTVFHERGDINKSM
jgi:hypothetical protein